jgi:putative transcriptional regulator
MIEFRLAHMMVERGMKGKDLAIAVGITARSVSRLKNRRSPKLIDTETLDKLCDALNCEPGDLLKRKRVEP